MTPVLAPGLSDGERLRRWWHGILPTTSHVVEVGTFEVLSPP